MAKQKTLTEVGVRDCIKEPTLFKVVIHNDDFTTMDFVVMILSVVFFKGQEDSESLMMKIHRTGRAVVGAYPYDIAVSKKNKAIELARQASFPLRVTVEE